MLVRRFVGNRIAYVANNNIIIIIAAAGGIYCELLFVGRGR